MVTRSRQVSDADAPVHGDRPSRPYGVGRRPWAPTSCIDVALRLTVASGLAIDAYVHTNLAHTYAESTGGINEGTLFQCEAAIAAVTAALVLFTGSRLAYLMALLIGASAAILAVLATYYQVGPFGPLPSLYDPVWYPEKTLSVAAESVAAVGAAVGLYLAHRAGAKKPVRLARAQKGGGNAWRVGRSRTL